MAVMTCIFWSNKVFQAIISFACLFPLFLNREVGGPKCQILHIRVRYLVYWVLNYFKGAMEGSGPEQCCHEHSSVFFLSIAVHDTCIKCRSCTVTIFGSVILV
jgi:hypothetical protein